jgi:hypothetical protein
MNVAFGRHHHIRSDPNICRGSRHAPLAAACHDRTQPLANRHLFPNYTVNRSLVGRSRKFFCQSRRTFKWRSKYRSLSQPQPKRSARETCRPISQTWRIATNAGIAARSTLLIDRHFMYPFRNARPIASTRSGVCSLKAKAQGNTDKS